MASARRAAGKAPRPSRRAMKDLLRPVGLDGPRVIALPPVMGPSEAAGLRDELIAARGGFVDLDGSQVARLGGLGLQVLLSAHATWRQDGQRLRLVDPSDALKEGVALFGAQALDPIICAGASR